MTVDLWKAQADPVAFRQSLLIDADGRLVRLGDHLDPWQLEDFASLDDGWKSVVGQSGDTTPVRRAWLERPRGHSKTSDLAVMCTWALFASKKRLSGYAAAASADQAKLLRNAIDTVVRANPWLRSILEVGLWKVTNRHTGSTLEIISSDAPTSYGLLPDFVVCDELTHWKSPDLWHSLISSAAKRKKCLLMVITNAGFSESWQWDVREAIRDDPNWHFSHLPRPLASWITPDRLAEQRKLLPLIAFNRLWLNQWTCGAGDALTDADIQAAMRMTGPLAQSEEGWIYFAGLDLGLTRDKAALAVVGLHVGYSRSVEKPRTLTKNQAAMIEAGLCDEPEPEIEESFAEATGRLKLAALHVWNPADQASGKVSIEPIEETIFELDQRFNLVVGCDPWQTAYLTERLQKRSVPIEPVNFTGQNLQSMCSATLEAFTENNLDLYRDPELLHDLHNLRVVEKSYGVRLDSPRGVNGHGDCATALAISLHLAKSATFRFTTLNSNSTLISYP